MSTINSATHSSVFPPIEPDKWRAATKPLIAIVHVAVSASWAKTSSSGRTIS
jgi:hypothetical protein